VLAAARAVAVVCAAERKLDLESHASAETAAAYRIGHRTKLHFPVRCGSSSS
jgi:hypothetical protein